jgi:hypothetical protein
MTFDTCARANETGILLQVVWLAKCLLGRYLLCKELGLSGQLAGRARGDWEYV